MTKRAAAGGQSLLISGALKMARSKRPPNNISLNHHNSGLALLEDTPELHAAVVTNHRHQHQRRLQQHSQHQRDPIHHNESSSSSSVTESISSPSSPALQEPSTKSKSGQMMTNASGTNTNSTASLTNTSAAHQIGGQHKQNHVLMEGKNKKLFPQKLWDLINDERYNFCLRWSEDGQLVYLNRDEFEDSYLKTNENQFHTQKAISFVRQMNMYGFRKVDDCYYENDNFKRGCEHLLKNMNRKHPNKTPTGASNQTSATSNGQDLSSFLYHKSITNNGVGRTLVDPMTALFAGGAGSHNPKMAHGPMQTVNDLQQPVDLRCAIQQAGFGGGVGSNSFTAGADHHLESTNNQNGQDLSHLIESLVAMSQANLLENTIRQHQEQQRQQQQQLQQIQRAHHNAPINAASTIAVSQATGDDTMDAELDTMGNPAERAYYASNESTAESISPIPNVTPPLDPAGLHNNFNVGNATNNLMNQAVQQDQPLALAAHTSQEQQQILNTLHLVRLMLQFSAQNNGTG